MLGDDFMFTFAVILVWEFLILNLLLTCHLSFLGGGEGYNISCHPNL